MRSIGLSEGGAFVLFFKKITHRYAEDFGKSVKLNVGDSSRAVLNAGNRTAADVHCNGFKLVRKPLLTHFLAMRNSRTLFPTMFFLSPSIIRAILYSPLKYLS